MIGIVSTATGSHGCYVAQYIALITCVCPRVTRRPLVLNCHPHRSALTVNIGWLCGFLWVCSASFFHAAAAPFHSLATAVTMAVLILVFAAFQTPEL